MYFALTAHLKVSQPPTEQGLSSHTWPSATTHGSTVQGPPLEMDAPSGWVLTWATPHQARNAAYWPEVQTSGSDRPWSPRVCACVVEAVINARTFWVTWVTRNTEGKSSLIPRNKCWMFLSCLLRPEDRHLSRMTFFPRTEEFAWRCSCWHGVHTPPWHTQIFGQVHPMACLELSILANSYLSVCATERGRRQLRISQGLILRERGPWFCPATAGDLEQAASLIQALGVKTCDGVELVGLQGPLSEKTWLKLSVIKIDHRVGVI